ncbi:MAG: late competence development ComFB family protein [Treponema sp.]|nr:late competence development ComFB family protein [Treponema sp.]
MELHNVSEDIVFGMVKKIFDLIAKEGNPEDLCLCDQCRMDTICYTLNRIEPRYIVSNRGIGYIEQDWAWKQQMEADVSTLAYKGLRIVNHKQRPTSAHKGAMSEKKIPMGPIFDLPTIIGRLLDGTTFAPLSDVKLELWSDGELVTMRNPNWQNPFTLVSKTPGTYTFWPAPVSASVVDVNRLFDCSLKVEDPRYETMVHYFKVPAVSEHPSAHSQSKTFKMPDLYLFPPGEAEING